MSWWRRFPWLDAATLLGLYALAVALRWPLLQAPPYGDEGLHYWVSRAFTEPPTSVTDVEGSSWVHPGWIFWQRPAYYVLLHPFALHGFEAFRAGHVLLSSLLPLAAWSLVRAHGGHRAAAAFAGLACATLPSLVTWGALAMMDEPMALALAFALAARRVGRHSAASVLFLVSVWLKETALPLVAILAAASFARAWWRGEAALRPLRLDGPTGSFVLPLALGPFTLMLSLATGLDSIGGWSAGHSGRMADWLYVTPWFIPVLLAGLAWRPSRPVCAFALVFATAYLLSHAWGGRSVEAWYFAGPVPFVLCGVALALDHAVRHATRALARAGAGAAAVGALLLVGTMVLAPASAAKGAWPHPFTGQPDDSVLGTQRYELELRDRGLRDAIDRMGLDGTQGLVTVDLYYPQALALAEGPVRARHVYVDSGGFRDLLPLWVDGFAARVEANGTWLLVLQTETAFFHAINEAYGDCRVLENAEVRLYEAWRCPGGRDALQQGYASRRPPAA